MDAEGREAALTQLAAAVQAVWATPAQPGRGVRLWGCTGLGLPHLQALLLPETKADSHPCRVPWALLPWEPAQSPPHSILFSLLIPSPPSHRPSALDSGADPELCQCLISSCPRPWGEADHRAGMVLLMHKTQRVKEQAGAEVGGERWGRWFLGTGLQHRDEKEGTGSPNSASVAHCPPSSADLLPSSLLGP